MNACKFLQHARSGVFQLSLCQRNRIASFEEPSTSVTVAEITVDWEKCVVCQQITDEVLEWPPNSKWSVGAVDYKTLVDNLLPFINRFFLLSWLQEGQDYVAILL